MSIVESVVGAHRPDFMANEDLAMFEHSIGGFLDQHASPSTIQRFRENGIVPRSFWEQAGKDGILGLSIPEAFGGAGGDFRHEVVLMEQIGRRGFEGWDVTLHNSIIAPYILSFGSDEQKQRWLPKMVTGDIISAIAMSEPGAGSDLQGIKTTARLDGNHYVLNGSKTFITNGKNASLIIVAAKTDPTAGAKGLSLIVFETDDAEGFERGSNLDKIGRDSSDTSELFFNDVRVPTSNLLGSDPGHGFSQLMQKLPQERLILAVQAMAAIDFALAITIDYVKQRRAFGKALIEFQNTQFKLAECKTQASIAQVYVDHCTQRLLAGDLDSATASMAKYWVTEAHCRIVDECLQLFGGYGYMSEYPIAQAYKDARINRIYGGTNEIMKILIARTL